MGLFNRKARFIERRKQQFALEPGERDRRKTPHIYPQIQQHIHTHNTTVVNNTPVIVDNSPDLLTTMVEAEIIADAMQPSGYDAPAPSYDPQPDSQPDTPCYDAPADTSSFSDAVGSCDGGGGESGGGGAGGDW